MKTDEREWTLSSSLCAQCTDYGTKSTKHSFKISSSAWEQILVQIRSQHGFVACCWIVQWGGGIKTYIWSELNRVRGYFMYNDSLVYILNTALPQCTFLDVLSPTRVIGFKLIALKVCNSSWTQNTDWLSEVLSFIESHLYFIRLKMNRWFVFEMMISHFVSNFTNMRDCSFQD